MRVRAIAATAIKDTLTLFRFHQDVQKVLNGGIAFGQPVFKAYSTTPQVQNGLQVLNNNIDGVYVAVQTPAMANVEFVVPHNLNRVPTGFDIKRINAACNIYDDGTTWTTTNIYLKCSATSVNVILFVH